MSKIQNFNCPKNKSPATTKIIHQFNLASDKYKTILEPHTYLSALMTNLLYAFKTGSERA